MAGLANSHLVVAQELAHINFQFDYSFDCGLFELLSFEGFEPVSHFILFVFEDVFEDVDYKVVSLFEQHFNVDVFT